MTTHTYPAEGAAMAEFAMEPDRACEDRLWPSLVGATGVIVTMAGLVLGPLL
ncbi:hypothetical protein [Prescottella agglutinans]|uniref:Uncharacterized protein n=1 Tax=Prescottella agglutinans TaxID=1644129 RepID=A0ABT6MLD8_9NOCA|nr:hypothetical protein [Prescottella agglutinans]MDH6284616.1 hypothetical protein [Prescottella agglutinans]